MRTKFCVLGVLNVCPCLSDKYGRYGHYIITQTKSTAPTARHVAIAVSFLFISVFNTFANNTELLHQTCPPISIQVVYSFMRLKKAALSVDYDPDTHQFHISMTFEHIGDVPWQGINTSSLFRLGGGGQFRTQHMYVCIYVVYWEWTANMLGMKFGVHICRGSASFSRSNEHHELGNCQSFLFIASVMLFEYWLCITLLV